MRALVNVALLVVSTAAALWVAEMLAGRYLDRAAHAEHMAPGLLRFDNRIGWRLSPGWHGRHQHHDYDVRYTIEADGYRKSAGTDSPGAARINVYGDSYTFR